MSGYLPATISYCTRCGAEVESGSQFCGSCGQALALPRSPSYAPVMQPFPGQWHIHNQSGGFGKLFSASGRIGRLEYFLTIVLATITGQSLDWHFVGIDGWANDWILARAWSLRFAGSSCLAFCGHQAIARFRSERLADPASGFVPFRQSHPAAHHALQGTKSRASTGSDMPEAGLPSSKLQRILT